MRQQNLRPDWSATKRFVVLSPIQSTASPQGCAGLMAHCLGIAIVGMLFAPVLPIQAQSNASPPRDKPAMSTPTPPLALNAAIERLFTAPKIQSEWFAPEFLSQIPLVQVEQLIAELKTTLGAYQTVQPEGDAYVVTFARGKMLTQIALSPEGQITLLWFRPYPTAISPNEAIQQLKTLPGEVNFLVLEGSKELAALNADRPLAVGSTFKLAVLRALNQQIRSGQQSWANVVALQPQWKSLPSGILQTWFDGALITIQSLATLMISQSDNTATDALIQIVGRTSVEALTTRNQPFLTTREAFIFKVPENQMWLDRYRKGSLEQKRQVLNQLAEVPLPAVSSLRATPTALDIEWFFTPRELCQFMKEVADLPVMRVNPSALLNPADWTQVAYKGGSEPGVLNLTTQLRDRKGKTYCISATWNNTTAALDDARFFALYSAVIEGLKARH